MTAYILRRLAQLIPVLFLASLGIWAMVYAVPGSPVGAIVGENATPEQIADTIKRLGLDRPLYEQYWTWLRGAVVGGTVVTEAVFTYPGIGRLLIQAIGGRDYPLIQGCILFVLVIYVLMNVLVDVLYAYIDPRIEYR